MTPVPTTNSELLCFKTVWLLEGVTISFVQGGNLAKDYHRVVITLEEFRWRLLSINAMT
jgi:hypothetical protein